MLDQAFYAFGGRATVPKRNKAVHHKNPLAMAGPFVPIKVKTCLVVPKVIVDRFTALGREIGGVVRLVRTIKL